VARVYEVVRLMPPGPDGVLQYRVKRQGDEWMVSDTEIEKA